MDPLAERVTYATTLGDHQADEGIVVSSLNMGFADPPGQLDSGAILGFDDDSLSVGANTTDVTAIPATAARSAFDPVVIEGVGQRTGYRRLEAGTSLLGTTAGAGHDATPGLHDR